MVTKIVEDFLKHRKSATDILYRLGKIDIKELDEVLNMLKFYEQTEAYSLKGLTVLDVGCGKRPTLGIIYAFNYKSNRVISIDPIVDDIDYNTRNFSVKKLRLNEWNCDEIINEKEIILFANHSHHPLKDVYDLFRKCPNLETIHYYVCPCCEDNVPRGTIMKTFKPEKSISPKNNYYYAVLKRENIKL